MSDRCSLCETRKPKRHCPGVRGEICALCCGREREETVDCPATCEYLIEARKHERAPEVDSRQVPNPDIRVTEEFIRQHGELFTMLSVGVVRAATATPAAVDADVRECLESAIRTYRTRQSGLVYDTRPANPYAAAMQDLLFQQLEEYRQAVAQRSGIHSVRDVDVLGVLVFLQRIEWSRANGRRRGRAFLDFLRTQYPMLSNDSEPRVIS